MLASILITFLKNDFSCENICFLKILNICIIRQLNSLQFAIFKIHLSLQEILRKVTLKSLKSLFTSPV